MSRGETLRPLSGAGRLALAVPTARIVACTITGAVDVVRFPKRPRIEVRFSEPSGGQPAEGESAVRITKRVMAGIREQAPPAPAGRHPSASKR